MLKRDIATVAQLAERLYVSPSTIYRRYRTAPGQLPPAIRVTWSIRFLDVDKWLLKQARLGRRRHNAPRVATTPTRRHNEERVATTPKSRQLRRGRRKR